MAAGGRHTDSVDLPAERTAYALRDLVARQRIAARHGPAIGAHALALLDRHVGGGGPRKWSHATGETVVRSCWRATDDRVPQEERRPGAAGENLQD